MDAKQFLAEFGHMANAPGGVQHLRELVLQFAIQGKLVAIDATDESTMVLLEKIKKEKKQLIKGEVLPDQKMHQHSANVEMATDFPAHWANPLFGDVWLLISGRDLEKNQYNESKVGIPYITGASNIENGELVINRWTDHAIVISHTNDLLISCKGTIGKTVFNTIGYAHIARQIMAIRSYSKLLNSKFLKIWLDSFVLQLVAKSKSMIPGFSRDDILYERYPLPPLKEQSRIVAKVDELMKLCNDLEDQQQKKRQLQNQLRQSVLQAIANAESPKELKDSWERLAGNFSHLFAETGDVADFKGMILDLAVSGQLLKYGKIDATGEDVLSLVKEERLKWAAESEDQELKEAQAMIKKIRNQKIIFPDTPLPKHWAWGSFLQISQAVIDCHNKTAPYVSDGIHLVRTTDIRDGKMDLRNTKKITEETYAYWARRMSPRSGDIFFTREAPMGEVAIVPEGEKVCLGQRTMLIRLFPHLFNNQFLVYVIQSPGFQKRMLEDAIGMTVKHLRVGGVEDLIVPIPPKNEQDKLVELIRDLFKKCDRFHNQLQRERIISANLATAAIASLTGISTPQQEEPMKVPKTELKAPVRLGTAQLPSNAQAPLATLLARHNGEMGANDLWQRFGGEVDAFYAQLKTEVMHGWIAEPTGAQMLEREAD